MSIQEKLNQLNYVNFKAVLMALIEAGRGPEASKYLKEYRINGVDKEQFLHEKEAM